MKKRIFAALIAGIMGTTMICTTMVSAEETEVKLSLIHI